MVSLTPREHIPSDSVCDSCEDPVQFSQRGSPVIQSARNPRQDVVCISATMATEIGKSQMWEQTLTERESLRLKESGQAS